MLFLNIHKTRAMTPIGIKRGAKPHDYPRSWAEWINIVLYGAQPYSPFRERLKRIQERIAQKGIRKRK